MDGRKFYLVQRLRSGHAGLWFPGHEFLVESLSNYTKILAIRSDNKSTWSEAGWVTGPEEAASFLNLLAAKDEGIKKITSEEASMILFGAQE